MIIITLIAETEKLQAMITRTQIISLLNKFMASMLVL